MTVSASGAMELILWRHADAESGIPDHERRLSPKGQDHARRVAEWLGARLPKERVILVSPARRAQETASALSETFDTRDELGTAATADAVLEAAGWPSTGTVVVVGHQPSLGQAAALALTGRPADWRINAGGFWWLARGEHDRDTVLRAAMSPDLL